MSVYVFDGKFLRIYQVSTKACILQVDVPGGRAAFSRIFPRTEHPRQVALNFFLPAESYMACLTAINTKRSAAYTEN
jgi:hypothetical protein